MTLVNVDGMSILPLCNAFAIWRLGFHVPFAESLLKALLFNLLLSSYVTIFQMLSGNPYPKVEQYLFTDKIEITFV